MTVSALVSSGRSLLDNDWLSHDDWSFLVSQAGAEIEMTIDKH